MSTRSTRMLVAESLALAGHAALLVVLWSLNGPRAPAKTPMFDEVKPMHIEVVWLAGARGESHGGGGGGDHDRKSPAHIQLPGRDGESMPIATERVSETLSEPDPPAIVEHVVLEARRTALGTAIVPGVLEPSLSSMSRGPGDGDGAGGGQGPGLGDDRGPGLGPGRDGGTDGGIYDPRRNGVSAPIALVMAKPRYTAPAMQAHIEGSVLIECVVEPNGLCRDVRVIRSLDPTFGLDREAIRATEGWRFRPGTLGGKAVPVLVRIELEFAIR